MYTDYCQKHGKFHSATCKECLRELITPQTASIQTSAHCKEHNKFFSIPGGRCEECDTIKLEELQKSGELFSSEFPAEELEKPERYNKGKIEVWDFILDQGLGFLDGNIIKYICRRDKKGKVEDLKKARVYLDKLIAEEEKNGK